MNKRIFAIVCALSILGAAAAGANDSFLISGKISMLNGSPRVAVNTKTGDMLVVWTQRNPNVVGYGRVYAALCTPLQDGTYKANKPKLISAKTGLNCRAYAAFNRHADEFLVVWDTYNIDSDITHPSKILSRRVNSTGKAVGPIVTTVDAKQGESYPLLVFIEVWAAPGVWTEFLLVWNRFPVEWDDRALTGMWGARVDGNGKLASTPKQIVQGKWEGGTASVTGEQRFFGAFPDVVVHCPQSQFFLVGATKTFPPYDDYSYEAHLVKLDNSDTVVNSVRLDEKYSYATRLLQLSPSLFVASWYKTDGSLWGYWNRRFSDDLKPIKKSYQPLKKMDAGMTDLVKLADDPGGYQISTIWNGDIYGRYVKPSGKTSGSQQLVRSPTKGVLDLRAAPIPGGNTVFVVWQQKDSDKKNTIRGYVHWAR
jgi:hypothetical protein